MRVLRVLLDTNIFISYLLVRTVDSPIIAIVERGIQCDYTLLVPEALLEEFVERIATKPYLEQHISKEIMHEFVQIVRSCSETIPLIEEEIPAVTRDPKDDYLLAYALLGSAEYLITGDEDLLCLAGKKEIAPLRILTPRDFLSEL